jgi:3-dehydroquinate synthase
MPGHKAHLGPSLTLLWRTALNAETKVFIGEQEIARLAAITSQTVSGKKILLLQQGKHRAVDLDRLSAELKERDFALTVMQIPDGEAGKSKQCLLEIWKRLEELKFSRQDTILAIGGGAVSDIAGFAASTYLRGVNLIVVPTTVLAQVDAAIGGKTGINVESGKNLIGSYYFAKAIVVDPSVLATLPRRAFVSGLAEIVKYGLLEQTIAENSEYKPGAKPLFSILEASLGPDFDHADTSLPGIITSCIKMKLAVVGADPFEKDLRRCLNLGHTLGHALERASDFAISHGEAVSIGLVFALNLSVQEKKIDANALTRVRTLLEKVGLPLSIPDSISIPKTVAALFQDKKRQGQSITMILAKDSLGQVDYHYQVTTETIEKQITAFAANPIAS